MSQERCLAASGQRLEDGASLLSLTLNPFTVLAGRSPKPEFCREGPILKFCQSDIKGPQNPSATDSPATLIDRFGWVPFLRFHCVRTGFKELRPAILWTASIILE